MCHYCHPAHQKIIFCLPHLAAKPHDGAAASIDTCLAKAQSYGSGVGSVKRWRWWKGKENLSHMALMDGWIKGEDEKERGMPA